MFINDGEYVQLDAYQELERQLAEARKLIKDYRKDHSDDASEWSIERGPCDMESDELSAALRCGFRQPGSSWFASGRGESSSSPLQPYLRKEQDGKFMGSTLARISR
jgi:hypothetical protein